jgi:hypothetical protein
LFGKRRNIFTPEKIKNNQNKAWPAVIGMQVFPGNTGIVLKKQKKFK